MSLHLSTDSPSIDPDSPLAALAYRLPDLQPRARLSDVYRAVSGVRGIPGRNTLYRLVESLDGAHLAEDLILRVGPGDRASRREVVIRPRLPWDAQRTYLRQYQALGEHPPRRMSYWAAHALVRRERGPASALACEECDAYQAEEWSYNLASPFEQADEEHVWSPFPEDYDALCRRCHRSRDEVSPFAPPAPPAARARRVMPRLPLDAPSWVPGPRSRAEHLAALLASA